MKLGEHTLTQNVNYYKEKPNFHFELVHGTCIGTIYILYIMYNVSFELNSIVCIAVYFGNSKPLTKSPFHIHTRSLSVSFSLLLL